MGYFKAWIAALAVAGSALIVPPALAQGCNEQCLKTILHQYLQQLPRHDPGPLSVSPQINARENTEPVKLGEDSWKSVSAVLPGLEFADPTAGQVIYAGGVRRDGALGTMFLRLKVVDGRITESEMLTTGPGAAMPPRPVPPSADHTAGPAGATAAAGPRAGGPRPAPDLSGLLHPDILYDAVVPEDRRSTRDQLANVPLLYMEGLARGDGSIPPFGPRCDRYAAGGHKLTNNPANRGGAVSCAMAVSAMKQMQGLSVVNRRVAVVDVPHGIAVGLFIVAGNLGGRAFAQDVAEVFKVVDGKIRSIEEFGAPGQIPPDSGFQEHP
jgi:hypothetical protein